MTPMKSRKTPIRTCVSCRQAAEKAELLRIVRVPDGAVLLDPSGKSPGRGAYLCGAKECLAKALKEKRLARALRCEVPPDLVDELKNRILPLGQGGERTGNRDECNES